MEKIDLTKCNNCRFKAEISNSGPISGHIEVEESGVYLRDEKGDYNGFLSLDGEEIISISGCAITDFEIVPRDPETYRDWQVGDTIEYSDNYSTGRIIFRSGDFVAVDIDGCTCYTCEELFDDGYRLILTDIEQQIIEEKKKYEPQDGDICHMEGSDGYCSIFIYKNGFHRTNYYASLDTDKGCLTFLFTTGGHVAANSKITVLRPATEEEKQKLFEAMAKEGKRWNAEKKVVEDIPKPYEFRKGEPVLVRDGDKEIWRLRVYIGSIEDSKYTTYLVKSEVIDSKYRYCIPYNERTMHLLGTSEDYKEEQL